MESYETTRQRYKPKHIAMLLIAESPPPSATTDSSRQCYRTGRVYPEDRLFTNTIRALYPETSDIPLTDLAAQKEQWLRRFQQDGWYMIEALEESQKHEVTKQQRQEKIRKALPRLIARVTELA